MYANIFSGKWGLRNHQYYTLRWTCTGAHIRVQKGDNNISFISSLMLLYIIHAILHTHVHNNMYLLPIKCYMHIVATARRLKHRTRNSFNVFSETPEPRDYTCYYIKKKKKNIQPHVYIARYGQKYRSESLFDCDQCIL